MRLQAHIHNYIHRCALLNSQNPANMNINELQYAREALTPAECRAALCLEMQINNDAGKVMKMDKHTETEMRGKQTKK